MGEPLELEAKGIAQGQCDHVRRHRHADDRDDGGQSVEDGVPLEGCNDAEHKAPTMAPSVTAMPPTRMEMGRRDWISWEMGVFLEIL